MSNSCKPEPGSELTTTLGAPDTFTGIAIRPDEKTAHRGYSLDTRLLGQCEHSFNSLWLLGLFCKLLFLDTQRNAMNVSMDSSGCAI